MEFLTKSIGGLPVWAWGLAAGGGIWLGMYFKRQVGTQSSSQGDANIIQGPVGTPGEQGPQGNPGPPGPPATEPVVPPTPGGGGVTTPLNKYYTVRRGDTLSKIAARFGTNVDQLVAWNKAKYPSLAANRNLIFAGWSLRVG